MRGKDAYEEPCKDAYTGQVFLSEENNIESYLR